MRKIVSLLLALLMVVSLAACNRSTDNTPAPTDGEAVDNTPAPMDGGTMVIATTSDASTMNLYEFRGVGDAIYTEQIFESLMRQDKTGAPVPFLAKSVTGDPEALTYTIVLNEGILFHDGSELTAEVCKWNLDMYKEHGVLSSSLMSKIDNVEVTGDYTVEIHMSEWDPFLPNNMARPNGCGYMVSKQAYDEHGFDWVKEHPVTTAPFAFTSWERDTKVVLERFDDYWQGKPLLEGVEIVVYSTPLVAQAALETGDIHVLCNVTTDTAEYLKGKGYTVVSTAIPNTCYSLPMDCTDESDPLSNILVRQAICHAIDSKAITDTVFGDYAINSNQYSWPGSTYYNESVEYEYNLDKARELLTQAGYPDGFNTVIHALSGNPHANICQIVQEQLRQVNIEVTIDAVDTAGALTLINGWGTGMLLHPMSLSSSPAAQLAANFAQGLESGLGITTFIHPDDIHDLIQVGMGQSGNELVETFKEVQGMVFGDYCMIKVIGCTTAVTVISPELLDSGFGEISGSTGYTLNLAHFAK